MFKGLVKYINQINYVSKICLLSDNAIDSDGSLISRLVWLLTQDRF